MSHCIPLRDGAFPDLTSFRGREEGYPLLKPREVDSKRFTCKVGEFLNCPLFHLVESND